MLEELTSPNEIRIKELEELLEIEKIKTSVWKNEAQHCHKIIEALEKEIEDA